MAQGQTSSGTDAVVTERASSSNFEVDEALDLYRATAPWETVPLRGSTQGFSFETTVVRCGDLQVRDTTATGAMLNGHLKQRAGSSDLFVVSLTKAGSGNRHLIGETLVDIAPGDILFLPLSEHAAGWRNQFTSTSLVLPMDLIQKPASKDQLSGIISKNSPQALLLGSLLENLTAKVTEAVQGQAAGIPATAAALLSGVLFSGVQSDATQDALESARKTAIGHYIDRHLEDPNLSVGGIARAFQLSRASIYRQFEADGGVASFIKGRRLERALSLLTSSEASRGRIRDVAERVAFEDPLVFSRAFKANFGFSPSDALAIAPRNV